jgi:hypothetical protein
MYYIVVILMLPLFVYAGEIDKCNQLHTANEKSFCMAVATLSVGDCEKIANMELRSTCVFKVRDGQRQANSYHPMQDQKEITKK